MKRRGVKSPDHSDGLWYAAFDVWELVDSPLAGLSAGDKVVLDPYDLLNIQFSYGSAGHPL